MRIPFFPLLLIIFFNLFVDWYILRYLVSECRRKLWPQIQFWSAAALNLGLIVLLFLPVKSASDGALRGLMWVIFFYITIYVPKYLFVIFDGISRLPKLWHRKRLRGVTATGVVLGVIMFAALWWGALFNRYNIDVKEVDVTVPDLPSGLEGFRIAQISDLHVGTYGDDTTFVAQIVDRINSLRPDIVLFTGDIVNRKTDELEPFVSTLGRIRSRYGVYSILGNHDYGDYYQWSDTVLQIANNDRMEDIQATMGWHLLKNTYAQIDVKGDTLTLIGVENIGDPPFHVYGDLSKAYPTPGDGRFKILMTHNPAHWTNDIADSDLNIALTLSGHTHAMQMTFFGWSPAAMRYRTWGGLYDDESGKHRLYVNIGTGTVGFPARIGATPEITLITLRGSGKGD